MDNVQKCDFRNIDDVEIDTFYTNAQFLLCWESKEEAQRQQFDLKEGVALEVLDAK